MYYLFFRHRCDAKFSCGHAYARATGTQFTCFTCLLFLLSLLAWTRLRLGHRYSVYLLYLYNSASANTDAADAARHTLTPFSPRNSGYLACS